MVKVYIASDHAGFELKKQVTQLIKKDSQLEVIDLGTDSSASVDYPDYADQLCKKIKTFDNESTLKEFGILICGSGQGMAIRANKYLNIRAALVYNDEITQVSREHNDANIICLGSRFCNIENAIKWINIFKNTAFAGGRHQTRVAKVCSNIS